MASWRRFGERENEEIDLDAKIARWCTASMIRRWSSKKKTIREKVMSEEDDDLMDLLEKKFKDIKKKILEEGYIWDWNL